MCRMETMISHLDAQLGERIQSLLHALCEQMAANAMNLRRPRSLTVPIAGRYNRCCFIPTPSRILMPPDQVPISTRRFARVGRYQILATIAKGGMSVVYRAQDASGQGEIALKVMLPELTTKPNLLERFHR